MKPCHWKTNVPLYRTTLHFVAQKDSASLIAYRQKMVKEFGGPDDRLTDNPAFVSFGSDLVHVGIFISIADYTPGMLAHEIFHATNRILQRVNHPLNWETQEPHAYLLEWITDEIYKRMK